MMVQIGPYILLGVIVVFALGLLSLIGMMVHSSLEEKKAQQAAAETPRADTLAEQIKKQFQVEEDQKERVIYTKSGVAKTSVKQTRSAFSFQQDDAEPALTLESNFDNGVDNTFITPDKN